MEKRIITISREFGSGGRTIGKLVAEHLGIQCYDAELIQKLAAESGFDESYVKEAGEYTPGGFLASAFTDRSFGPTNEDLLWKLQYRIIRELAEKEPCVIVGRCADFILQDRTDCLKVFVHADMKFRADRIVRVYGEREKSPEARLKEKDKCRAAYYRFYTDMKCAFRYADGRCFLFMAVLWENQSSNPWLSAAFFKYSSGLPFRIKSA